MNPSAGLENTVYLLTTVLTTERYENVFCFVLLHFSQNDNHPEASFKKNNPNKQKRDKRFAVLSFLSWRIILTSLFLPTFSLEAMDQCSAVHTHTDRCTAGKISSWKEAGLETANGISTIICGRNIKITITIRATENETSY